MTEAVQSPHSDDATERLVVRYEGTDIELRCDDAGTMRWIVEFLVPHFEVVENVTPRHRVRVVIDAARYAALIARGPRGGTRPIFVLDSSVIDLPVWNTDDEDITVFEEQRRAFYRCGETDVTVLAARMEGGLRSPIMRIVRELAMNAAQHDGKVFLHASGFVWRDQAAVITAPKAFGKSTLLFYVLGDSETSYLANDRLLAAPERSGVRVRGMPTILSIRPPTFDFFPEVRDRLYERRFHFQSTLDEASQPASKPPAPWKDGRMGLTPAQACALFATRAVAEAQAKVLVFPRITSRPGGFELAAISVDEAVENLMSSVFGARHLDARSELTTRPAPDRYTYAQIREHCAVLAARMRRVELRVGLEAYQQSPHEALLRPLFAPSQ
jgi:hypothetical protein